MIKEVTRTTHDCDNCGKEQDWIESCQSCGKEFCYDCEKTQGIKYTHAVHFSGSGDGFFCHDCLATMKPSSPKYKLWQAYQTIASLKREADGFYKDFEKRSKAAEENLKHRRGD